MNHKKKLIESLMKRIIKEIDNAEEGWFEKNECLSKTYPNLKLNGANASYDLPNNLGNLLFTSDGRYIFTPIRRNPNAPSYLTPPKFGKWWCDTTTNKLNVKMNPDGKPDPLKSSNSTQKSGLIPKASSMEDVKNGKGYIIKGMSGPAVKELQQMLLQLGYDLGPNKDDSIFGTSTLNAIVDFQKKNGITPKNNTFGIFGRVTYNKIIEKLNSI